MDPRENKPGMLPPRLAETKKVPSLPPELAYNTAYLCVNCYPKLSAARFILAGFSYCERCFVPLRKNIDAMGPHECVPGIDKRDYKETWGKTREEDKDA